MYKDEIVVLKFGSSVLRADTDLPRAVHEIYRWYRQGAQVLAVVSAFGYTTDELMRRAELVCTEPDRENLAALVATGEGVSSALLALALNERGIPARVFDPAQAGLHTVGSTVDADLISVDVPALRGSLKRGVVVLPGFVGKGENGATTLLGRGGSDYTALFLARSIGARCVLLKDVDGIYTSDPATASVPSVRFAELRYETAAEVAGKLVQAKAIRFAAAHRLSFLVTSIGSTHETVVGTASDRLAVPTRAIAPLRVALLGCGIVGGGVYKALSSLPAFFEIVGVGTRSRDRARASGVADALITDDLEELVAADCDVVVELIGGTHLADHLISRALRSGRHVVTANKALLAIAGDRLARLAADFGVTLRYSAAVGGVVPALEAIKEIRKHDSIASFSGILNSTTNFVLDQLAQGLDLKAAVSAARQAGYAEADCRLDLNGTDAAHKLILLAQAAFDRTLRFDTVERSSIEELDHEWLRATQKKGVAARVVATCKATAGGLRASVKPMELPYTNPLATVGGVGNCLRIKTESGASFVVSGKGAGRWPTTEAVIADLMDLRRQTQLFAESQTLEEEVCA